MAWRPHGRAEVDSSNPRGWATCDRCGLNYNLFKLNYQFQWAGTDLINLRLRVCPTCMDTPSEFLRTVIIPPDPLPLIDPRPEPYVLDEVDYRATEDGDQRVTEADEDRVLDSTASEDYTGSSD